MKKVQMSPLAEFSDLDSLKKKFEGKTFKWVFRLFGESKNYIVEPIGVDFYRLAAGVIFEETAPEGKKERRREFRQAIKEEYESGRIAENKELNALLLSYCCTYDGALNLLADKNPPDVGILVELNVDKEEELVVLIVPIDLFDQNYQVLLSGKNLKDSFNW